MKPRNEEELKLMRESGRITAAALRQVLKSIRVGVSALELERVAAEEIKKGGGELAFPEVPGYKWATCITFNEQVVHGIPTERRVKEGDIISVDLGTVYQGWYTDAAWSASVDKQSLPSDEGQLIGESAGKQDRERFLRVGEEALWLGIKQAVEGKRIGDISSAIQQKVEESGYSVVRSLVGHGVGRKLHEDPEVPGYGRSGMGMELKSGMTLAIEVIYTKGKSEVVLESDGWTISSADGSLSGLFEMTIVVGKERAQVLTDWRH